MKKERLYPEEMENTGYYYFMVESAELADKIIHILKDRKCSSVHRRTIESWIYSKISTVPCFKFMDMPPFEKAMLVANGAHCTVFLSGNSVYIQDYETINENYAELIMNAHERVNGHYYPNYLLSVCDFERPYVPIQKAVAYYRKKGLL